MLTDFRADCVACPDALDQALCHCRSRHKNLAASAGVQATLFDARLRVLGAHGKEEVDG